MTAWWASASLAVEKIACSTWGDGRASDAAMEATLAAPAAAAERRGLGVVKSVAVVVVGVTVEVEAACRPGVSTKPCGPYKASSFVDNARPDIALENRPRSPTFWGT